MKNVLLPTDLSVASLYPIHEICQRANGQPVKIYVIHTLEMPTGIIDLLFNSDRKPYKLLSAQFLEAIEILRVKYASSIQLLSFEFVFGNSTPYLRNYMHARDISEVWMLENFDYSVGLPQTVDCTPALVKSKISLEYVPQGSVGEHRMLTTLLYQKRVMPV